MIQCRLSAEELDFLLRQAKKVSPTNSLNELAGGPAGMQCNESEMKADAEQKKGKGQYLLDFAKESQDRN
jgi:hypothetical protein